MMQKDSIISSPSTPIDSPSTQSNLISTISSNIPSIGTPIQKRNTLLNNSTANSSPAIVGTLGHKNSLKGTKLAKRARSFKDDLFEKISLIRTPTNTLGRPHSPNSPRCKSKQHPNVEEMEKSSISLETYVKDISNALKHFRDVILKKKLEVLPGNGTVILETIASMFSVIQSYMLNENSTVLLSATQQVYQSLGKLIKLCDEVLLSDENLECASLSSENVREVIDLLEDAVKNLVVLSQQKLKEKEELAFQYEPHTSEVSIAPMSHDYLMRPPAEVAGQRTSLPDITMTPKERDNLEKNTSNHLRVSYSTESILRDTSPPPKPPLPSRSHNPPPLPPKRSSQTQTYQHFVVNNDFDYSVDYSGGVEHLSVHSRSPDDNSSQCSLDSALNHSREDDELKRIDQKCNILDEDDVEKLIALKDKHKSDSSTKLNSYRKDFGKLNLVCSNTTSASTITPTISTVGMADNDNIDCDIIINNSDNIYNPEMRTTLNHRHSNESGFISINSYRTSTQSVSKHSSEFSFQSSTKSSTSSSEIAFVTNDFNVNEHLKQNHRQTTTNKTTVGISNSSTSSNSNKVFNASTKEMMVEVANDGNQSLSNINESFSNFEQEKMALSQLKSLSLLKTTSGNDIISSDDHISITNNLVPPALPPKIARNKDRQFSMYDNFDAVDNESGNLHEFPELRNSQRQHHIYQWQSKHTSLIEPRRTDILTGNLKSVGSGNEHSNEPPPLPMKKKHILAYMEICSASTRSIEQHRHTMHAYNLNRNITHSHTMSIVPLGNKDDLIFENDLPPALPPKNNKQLRSIVSTEPLTIITTPPPSPKTKHTSADHNRIYLGTQANDIMSTVCEESNDLGNENDSSILENDMDSFKYQKPTSLTPNEKMEEDECSGTEVTIGNPRYNEEKDALPNLLEEINITPYLIYKKENEEGPEIKGGYIDALIVHASHVQKITDNAFSEAFITTFRTFIQPIDVIEKLTHRYTVFFCQLNDQKQKAAKETFSLLVRVVNDLTPMDLTTSLLSLLVEFVYQLVCAGQLYLAKLLRNKIVEKVQILKELKVPNYCANNMFFTVTNQPSLLDLKSVEIAEQMTLLDAELFQKIEIPEVLLFAKEQCEEKSPNLNKFTEHFNKMSYWARSKILMLSCAKEREKHVIKFIKIMKHLRKMNNYNSYLALLSALDSAPIRRLEWHKTITEGLKEYCTLIDSSSSFRAYRQALAETTPPCIPYIGLVLQDLTFVHVGNPDYLKEGVINFSKRWQQYNIIVNMKRFRKCAYPFQRNERIIQFFENFENFLGEEEMWQISETIKPRGKRTIVHN